MGASSSHPSSSSSSSSLMSSSRAFRQTVLPAVSKHTATVIFLHGLGDTGDGWKFAFEQIRMPYIKYIFPTAHKIQVSINDGLCMNSWFDIRGLCPNSPEDEQGIEKASKQIKDLMIQEEGLGISSDRMILGGFSQGGALALYTTFTYEKPLGGVLALSSWLPLHRQFPEIVKGNQQTPILQCHGTADHLITFDFGKLTAKHIKTFNSNHLLKEYKDMNHCSCPSEMADVKEFIASCLPAQ